ncbi:MAG: hypothetical protein JST00_10565 [Deltaproteobacteria bacterium]|nr:hypothetical protein [Deltaproteobacteria bacterium]
MGETKKLGAGIIAGVVMLAAAACGGGTETTGAENDGGAGSSARPADCPRFVVLKSATRELSRDAICELHAKGTIVRTFNGEIVFLQPDCTTVCADPQMNRCALPESAGALVGTKRDTEDGGPVACPLSAAAGPIQVTCRYGEWQGTAAPGCPSD